MEILKIGDKQKHLQIPDGWRKLDSHEIICKYDKYANVAYYRWDYCTQEDDLGLKADPDMYFCVIREINPPKRD